MKTFIETERLFLREIMPSDKEGMFELDADAEVHRYLGNRPVKNRKETEEAIFFIRQQYIDNGIGRWAIIEKKSGHFVGWGGFKLITGMVNNHTNYHDIGYRLIKRYWGKGYATESGLAVLNFGFQQLELQDVYAFADIGNTASRHVLEKIGMSLIEKFVHEGMEHNWFQITKEDWLATLK